MDKLELQASNIKCAGCVSNVEKGLNEIAAVTNVSVDIPSNKVTVEGSELDKAVIEAKLAELGYPVQ
jgi:copper chaperone CopZ